MSISFYSLYTIILHSSPIVCAPRCGLGGHKRAVPCPAVFPLLRYLSLDAVPLLYSLVRSTGLALLAGCSATAARILARIACRAAMLARHIDRVTVNKDDYFQMIT